NVIAAKPTRLQDVVRIANNLIDQKLKGYAMKNAKNKKRLEVNQRDNCGQQPPFKRPNVRGQNVARAYTAGNNERKPYNLPLPLCNKCKLHYERPCTVRCGKCNKVGHLTRDCKVTNSTKLETRTGLVKQEEKHICWVEETLTPIQMSSRPEDSLIMRDKDLRTILKKELNDVIKFGVEDLVPIPSESEDTSKSDSECDLPSCDDFSPIDVPEGKSMTFSNPLFDSNDDFTSSDDESLSDEDVPEDNVKFYSNPLFEFDDKYISSDVNPLFDEVLKDIKSKAFYDSNLDEP
nr:reverse transcriptase domain-containing protein [Tanacetum cinerariifolium]